MAAWPGLPLWNSLLAMAVSFYYGGSDHSSSSSNYDFIVVGGGAAGAIMASQLSVNPSVRVLLLESGGSASNITDIPYMWFGLSEKDMVKNYYSEIQESGCCYGTYCKMPWGNLLGGGTSINGMLFVRGNRLDYDEWAAGGAGWGWDYDHMLPYMKQLEDYEEPGESRGTGGWVHVTNQEGIKFYGAEARRWYDAVTELGYPFGDYNGWNQAVMSFSQKAARNGIRESTENIFLRRQVWERKNLDIRLFAHVNKILFSGTRAIGVEYEKNNQKFSVHASKEVILSAGTLASPQILMLSGVGPRSHLEHYGINVVSDLPAVGQNFHDHVHVFLQYETDAVFDIERLDFNTNTYNDYLNNKKGVLTSTSGIGIGFTTTPNSKSWDDVRIQYNHGVGYQYRNGQNLQQINVLVDVTKPESRGALFLRSTNPYDQPLIYPNYLMSKIDLEDFVSGVNAGIRIFQTRAYRDINAKLIKPENVCTHLPLWSQEFIRCFIMRTAKSSLHYTSTCRLGNYYDNNAVVDPQLRVRGVQGLRVVDASVLPSVLRGNIVVPTMLVALKAADIVRDEYNIF